MLKKFKMMRNKFPSQDEIEQARLSAGLTQIKSAELVHVSERTWRSWVSKTDNHRQMPLAYFELFLIKTNQVEIWKKFQSQ